MKDNFRNTVTPNLEPQPSTGYSVQNTQPSYAAPMPDNQLPYPLINRMAEPYINYPMTYKKGGKVNARMANQLRQFGEGEDKILAHINPLEAKLLNDLFGSDLNPVTGLPQFGLFNRPGKWLKSVVGGAGGAILGNMLLPGIGGVIGGALGGAAGSAVRGRKDLGAAALRGGLTGAMLPTAAGLLGSAASGMGMSGTGAALSQYGTTNAILPSIGMGRAAASGGGFGGPAAGGTVLSSAASAPTPVYPNVSNALVSGAPQTAKEDFLSALGRKSGDFLTDPKNLLTLASTGSQFFNRPKEKTPEQLASERKRFEQGLLLTPEEFQAQEAQTLELERAKRRIQRNKFLPEERFASLDPIYARANLPEERQGKGRWVEYYDNAEFEGRPIPLKEGGNPLRSKAEIEENYLSGLIKGSGGGQDDDVPAMLPKNSYIINASTVADIGDGNTEAGANKIHALISDGEFFISPNKVRALGKGSVSKGVKSLDKMVKNVRKHKTGGVHLPPKAKPLKTYIKR